MLILQLLPVVLSLLILAAHFFRSDIGELVGLSVLSIALLAVPRRWAARLLQIALLAGAAEWVRTLVALYQARAQHGMPAGRMMVILAAVALFTAASALLFHTERAKRWFRPPAPSES